MDILKKTNGKGADQETETAGLGQNHAARSSAVGTFFAQLPFTLFQRKLWCRFGETKFLRSANPHDHLGWFQNMISMYRRSSRKFNGFVEAFLTGVSR